MQVLAHNILAQYTGRELNITMNKRTKSSEKLSSGYRINRSADDAAGLTISEKLRWQIRGLNKGKNNIMDGISLVDTADGALEEVHSILQRVRELSVQAYNDTYTQEDRDAIQSEIDQSLTEINRIAEDTTFNTMQILKGNPTKSVQVTADQVVSYTTTYKATKDLPAWLDGGVDKVLEVHSNYTGQQDTSGIMLKYDGVNDSSKQYYGPKGADVPKGYQHVKEWTDSISDNRSAKVNFGGMVKVKNSTELYENLYELIGCKLSYPCGTCSTQVNSITFSGNEESIKTGNFEPSAPTDITGDLNLSSASFTYNGKTYNGYFEAVQELVNKYAVNYDDDTKNDIAGEDKASVDLAKSIAKDLRDKTVDVLGTKMANHFNRVVKGNDAYSLIVYDYRDEDVLSGINPNAFAVKTSAVVQYEVSSDVLQPGTTVNVNTPLKIMCGALSTSSIDLNLGNVSLEALGLLGYKVNNYDTKTTYSASYQEKITAWENSATETIEKRKYTATIIDSQTPPIYSYKYVNGERTRFLLSPGKTTYREEEREYSVAVKKYGPKPIAKPGDVSIQKIYTPDSLERVDDAIGRVSAIRSELGATKNRLEHAYNLNANTEENTQATESKIRDTDMAKEMVELSNANILAQVGQAMLAQANQLQQGVLQLLQ